MDKKKTLLVICACIVLFFGVLFGLYKIIVTPKVIVGLALNNAMEDIAKTTDFFVDSDEKEVVERVIKNGGSLTMNSTVLKSKYIEGAEATITSNSDGVCSVTEIEFNEYLKIETYKDAERILVSTPLFGGGFEIKLEDLEGAIENSVFRDKTEASPETMAASAVVAYISEGVSAEKFYSHNMEELQAITDSVKVEKNGKSSVMTGSKTKKADEYTVHLSRDDMDSIVAMLKAYVTGFGIDEANAEAVLSSLVDECDIVFKIKNLELYEICINTSGTERVIAFTGTGNRFDSIFYYENDDIENAVKRYHDRRGNNITEKISVGDKTVLFVERGKDKTDIRIGSGSNPFVISASGKNVGDYYFSYRSFEFGIEDRFIITSDLYVSEDYDEEFSFDKSGEYIDLFGMTESDWKAVSGVLLSGINLFK